MPTFALTNFAADTFGHALDRFPVLRLFDDVVVSGEVGVAKPDPRIFDLTARRIGHDPASIYFTDDSPTNVAAALEAGWDAELFTGAEALTDALSTRGLLPPGGRAGRAPASPCRDPRPLLAEAAAASPAATPRSRRRR